MMNHDAARSGARTWRWRTSLLGGSVMASLLLVPALAVGQSKPPVDSSATAGGAPQAATTATPPAPAADLSVEVDPPRTPRQQTMTALGALLGPTYELGAVAASGAVPFAPPPSGDFAPTYAGFRYAERSGIVATLLSVAGLKALLYTMAGTPDSVSSESTSYTTYRGGQRYRVTETTTTATYGNMEQRQAMVDAANELGFADMAVSGSGFEIEVFNRDALGSGVGDAYGYRLAVLFPLVQRPYFLLESGWASGKVLTLDEESGRGWEYVSRGIPLRMHFPVLNVLSLHAGFDMNFSSFFDPDEEIRTSEIDGTRYQITEIRRWPIYMGANAYLWRFLLGAQVSTTRPLDLELGYTFTLAFRF